MTKTAQGELRSGRVQAPASIRPAFFRAVSNDSFLVSSTLATFTTAVLPPRKAAPTCVVVRLNFVSLNTSKIEFYSYSRASREKYCSKPCVPEATQSYPTEYHTDL
jgi:hypothetical protein